MPSDGRTDIEANCNDIIKGELMVVKNPKLDNPNRQEGEKVLEAFLSKVLPPRWSVYPQPYMNGGRPDIVAFNPEIGAVIYEVKDWDLNKYYLKNGILHVKNKTDALRTPMDQVKYHRYRLIELLSPLIGEAIDECKSVYSILHTCVYFHKASGKEAREFFQADDGEFPKIIGNDELTEMNICNIVPIHCKLNGVNKYMTKEFADEISFWLKPPFHSLEGTKQLKLSPKQREHSEPAEGHHRLKGETGSGKTIVIAYRAAKLASEGKKVLVVSYNITLSHYIRYLIDQVPYEFNRENIHLIHFHGFCKDVLFDAGIKPTYKSRNWINWIIPVINGILDNETYIDTIIKYRYDAILIDEGHDFESEWITCLSRFLNERNELLFVCDPKQNIYKRDMNWIEETTSLFRGRWGKLKTVYRLPPLIGEIASSFRIKFGLDVTPLECDDSFQTALDEIGLIPHVVGRILLS